MKELLVFGIILAICGSAMVLTQLVIWMCINCRILEKIYQGKRALYEIDEKKKNISSLKAFADDKADQEMVKIGQRKNTAAENYLRALGFLAEIAGGYICLDSLFGPFSGIYGWLLAAGAFLAAAIFNVALEFAVAFFSNRKAAGLYRKYHHASGR